jgi:FtsH-binding integral membrane protein
MSEAIGLGGAGAMSRDRSLTLFGQTMAYVAATAGFFALGAYAGRNLSESVGWVWFIAAIACLVAMNFTSRRSVPATVALLAAFGVLIGLATAPLLVYYADTDPAILWQAGGATALFIAGFGTAGYAIRRDLTALARVAFFASWPSSSSASCSSS